MSITQIVIKRPTLAVVLFSVLALLGIMSYSHLNYELLPKIEVPTITITTIYPGASASEVESSVTKKIEESVASLENLKNIQSTSYESTSVVVVQFNANTDLNIALQDAQRKLNVMLSELPDDAKTPSLKKASTDDMPVLRFGVTADLPATELYQYAKDRIKPQFSKLKGVGTISMIGGTERQIRINVNKSKLNSYRISITQVYSAIANANLELPAGNITSTKQQYSVRLSGKITSLDDLKKLTVSRTQTGGIIHLSDVAEVVDGTAEIKQLNRINGENSIGMLIRKQSDANTVEVCELARNEISKLEKNNKDIGLKFTIASDTSIFTLDSANDVMKDLLYAVIIVAFIMFLFLHSLRNSFIIMISIPCSIISVFVAMYIFDFSLNLMTLMALSLIVGVLVDDSIVVLENTFRHLEMGKSSKQAAIDGRNEIGFSALAITLVDVVVFVPLSLVSGTIGDMLREFSLVIVFSTLMSLLVSFTITPLLASRFSKLEKINPESLSGRFSLKFESFFTSIINLYERILRWVLGHRKVLYGIVVLLFVGAFALPGLGLIGSEFVANPDRGEFIIRIEGEPQNTLYQTNMQVQKVEELLYAKPEVVKVFSNIGYSGSGNGSGSSSSNKSELTVDILPKDQRLITVEKFAAQIKSEIQNTIPGLKVTASAVNIVGIADDAPISILLRGANVDQLFEMGDSIMDIMKEVPGTRDIKLSVENSKPEFKVSLNREKMDLLNLSVYEISNTLRLAFAGSSNLNFSENGADYDMMVQFDEFDRNTIDDIGSLTFINNKGERIELRDFATFYQTMGANKLERYDRISSLTVKASVFNRPVGTVGEEIRQAIENKITTDKISIDYKGQMESQSDAFGSLGTAMLMAIICVYLVMVALYNSYIYPFVVLFSIPVAIIGALLALALTGNSLSIFSIIGIIMLIGLVAKNAILLVDFTNHARDKGASVLEALVEAGKERLRPIIMTTMAMIFGMLPIALASGASSEIKSGLAWVVIGGLTSSLLLTLVLVPSVYATFVSIRDRVRFISTKKRPDKTIINSTVK